MGTESHRNIRKRESRQPCNVRSLPRRDRSSRTHGNGGRDQGGIQGHEKGGESTDRIRQESDRLALSAYTWPRTDRGASKHWLYHIRKAEFPACGCGHLIQNGYHITFECPKHRTQGRTLLGTKKAWEELDSPDWRKEGDGEPFDAIEVCFTYLCNEMS